MKDQLILLVQVFCVFKRWKSFRSYRPSCLMQSHDSEHLYLSSMDILWQGFNGLIFLSLLNYWAAFSLWDPWPSDASGLLSSPPFPWGSNLSRSCRYLISYKRRCRQAAASWMIKCQGPPTWTNHARMVYQCYCKSPPQSSCSLQPCLDHPHLGQWSPWVILEPGIFS